MTKTISTTTTTTSKPSSKNISNTSRNKIEYAIPDKSSKRKVIPKNNIPDMINKNINRSRKKQKRNHLDNIHTIQEDDNNNNNNEDHTNTTNNTNDTSNDTTNEYDHDTENITTNENITNNSITKSNRSSKKSLSKKNTNSKNTKRKLNRKTNKNDYEKENNNDYREDKDEDYMDTNDTTDTKKKKNTNNNTKKKNTSKNTKNISIIVKPNHPKKTIRNITIFDKEFTTIINKKTNTNVIKTSYNSIETNRKIWSNFVTDKNGLEIIYYYKKSNSIDFNENEKSKHALLWNIVEDDEFYFYYILSYNHYVLNKLPESEQYPLLKYFKDERNFFFDMRKIKYKFENSPILKNGIYLYHSIRSSIYLKLVHQFSDYFQQQQQQEEDKSSTTNTTSTTTTSTNSNKSIIMFYLKLYFYDSMNYILNIKYILSKEDTNTIWTSINSQYHKIIQYIRYERFKRNYSIHYENSYQPKKQFSNHIPIITTPSTINSNTIITKSKTNDKNDDDDHENINSISNTTSNHTTTTTTTTTNDDSSTNNSISITKIIQNNIDQESHLSDLLLISEFESEDFLKDDNFLSIFNYEEDNNNVNNNNNNNNNNNYSNHSLYSINNNNIHHHNTTIPNTPITDILLAEDFEDVNPSYINNKDTLSKNDYIFGDLYQDFNYDTSTTNDTTDTISNTMLTEEDFTILIENDSLFISELLNSLNEKPLQQLDNMLINYSQLSQYEEDKRKQQYYTYDQQENYSFYKNTNHHRKNINNVYKENFFYENNTTNEENNTTTNSTSNDNNNNNNHTNHSNPNSNIINNSNLKINTISTSPKPKKYRYLFNDSTSTTNDDHHTNNNNKYECETDDEEDEEDDIITITNSPSLRVSQQQKPILVTKTTRISLRDNPKEYERLFIENNSEKLLLLIHRYNLLKKIVHENNFMKDLSSMFTYISMKIDKYSNRKFIKK
jgi:hypothetical protein